HSVLIELSRNGISHVSFLFERTSARGIALRGLSVGGIIMTGAIVYLSREGRGYNIEVNANPNRLSRCEVEGAMVRTANVNRKALAVMNAIESIHATMSPRAGKSSVELVREAREGAMYE